jgi:type II secretory ATPase GspE/PulE/Tfp pilus assembly ATPase PilB-like protein
MPLTAEISEPVMANAPAGDIRRVARDQGMRTLREEGLAKPIDGITALDEVARVTAE